MNGEPDWKHCMAAALRRFPARSLQIRELSMRDEDFRGMCEDFAAAENALAAVDQLPVHVREERRAEFKGLIESLAAEIAEALARRTGSFDWRHLSAQRRAALLRGLTTGNSGGSLRTGRPKVLGVEQ